MKFNPAWLAAAVIVGLLPTAAAAQFRQRDREPRAGEPPPIYAGGTDIFRYLFHRAGIEPLSDGQIHNNDLSDLILVVIGDGTEFTDMPEIASIIRQGGAVLVATDATSRAFSPAVPGARGASVKSDKEGTHLLDRSDCPFAVPLTPFGRRVGSEIKLFEGLDRIATNRPSFFSLNTLLTGDFRFPLAGFPKGARYRSSFDGREQELDPRQNFLAAGASRSARSGRPCRLLAVADPSIFLNEMMVPIAGEETHNLHFADRVVKFLAERDDGSRRTHCLFVHNGSIVSDFKSLEQQLASKPPPIRLPDPWQLQEKIVDAGNQIVDKFQDNGGPSALVMGRDRRRQNERLRWLLRTLLVIGSICAVAFLVRRVWRARQPTDTPPAPPGGRAQPDSDRPPPGVFQRRQREVLRRNNLREPVRMALREFFESTGAPVDTGPKLPKVVLADAVRRPDTLRKALQDLWRIAYGPPAVLTIQKWKLLEPLLDRVQKAHADGKWRFVVSEESMARSEA